ncbi:hypothetical protein V7O66_10460 [Methanolobus sp. ZRKC3]|uniref:hypothetical protein n=1 Tax=Methanolobus sp. ZRKC3 TaxID=3125786 RepID=UPI003250B609
MSFRKYSPIKHRRVFDLPQKDENTSKKAIQNQSGHIEKMSIPIQMIDLRSLAMIIGLVIIWFISSFIDHLYRTVWTYLGFALFTLAILVLLFLLSSRKISIGYGSFQMNNPILGKTILSKDRIQKVTYIDNSNYKHRNIQYIVIGIATLVIWAIQISSMYGSISKYGFEDGTNLFSQFS